MSKAAPRKLEDVDLTQDKVASRFPILVHLTETWGPNRSGRISRQASIGKRKSRGLGCNWRSGSLSEACLPQT